jgi:hypothetical protein
MLARPLADANLQMSGEGSPVEQWLLRQSLTALITLIAVARRSAALVVDKS